MRVHHGFLKGVEPGHEMNKGHDKCFLILLGMTEYGKLLHQVIFNKQWIIWLKLTTKREQINLPYYHVYDNHYMYIINYTCKACIQWCIYYDGPLNAMDYNDNPILLAPFLRCKYDKDKTQSHC